MDIILNKIAIWKPVIKDGLLCREVPDGTDYRVESIISYRKSKGMIRYVKNYSIGNGKNRIKYSLFVRTTEKNQNRVEAHLDAVASRLSDEYIKDSLMGASLSNFVYTDYSLEDELEELNDGD